MIQVTDHLVALMDGANMLGTIQRVMPCRSNRDL
jgi:hypothetical protein